MKKSVSSLAVAVGAVYVLSVLPGCVAAVPGSMPRSISTPSKTTPRSYKPLDYAKWTSGLYPDEFFGQPVVVEGYVRKGMQMGQIRSEIPFWVGQYSQKEIQQKAMQSPMAGTNLVSSMVSVVAPMAMRDQIFQLQDEQKIRVYGVVENPYGVSGITGQVTSSMLRVRADRIESVR